MVGVDAAPGAHGDVGVAHDVLGQEVGHGVAKLSITGFFPEALHLALVLAVFDAQRVEQGVDGLARHANVQADQIALRIQPGAHLGLRDGAVEVMGLVFFAGPQQFDGRAHELLGNRRGLVHIVLRAAASAKTAAQVLFVNLALRQGDACGLCQGSVRGLAILRGHPALGAGDFAVRTGRQFDGGVHRLHGRVGQEGGGVGGLHLGGGAGNRAQGVALGATGHAAQRHLGVQALGQVGGNAGAVDLGVDTFVPNKGEFFKRGLGTPPGVGHHRHRAGVDTHHAFDAAHGLNRIGVKAHQGAAKHGAVFDGRAQHAGQLKIGPIDQAAIELLLGVKARHGLARNGPIFGVFQHDGFDIGRGQLGRRLRHLAVAQLALAGPMGDHALADLELSHRHIPLVGGGLQQHHAGCCAALAHVLLRDANAPAAAGGHLTPGAFARHALAGGGHLGADFFPVAFQFFGHQLGQPGARALAHLGAGNADDAAVIGLDDNPDVDFGVCRAKGGLRAGLRHVER